MSDQTTRVLADVEALTGSLPAEIAAAIAAHARISKHARRAPETLPDARVAAVEKLLEWAGSSKETIVSITSGLADAIAADAAADEASKVYRSAVERAERNIQSAAANNLDEVYGALKSRVAEAVKDLYDAAPQVPAGMSDATAFRAAPMTQDAWRRLSAAAETISTALDICRRIVGPAGLDQAPQGYATQLPHTLTESGDFPDFYPGTEFIERLRILAERGVPMSLADPGEYEARQQRRITPAAPKRGGTMQFGD